MATLKKATAGLWRVKMDGIRWRLFDCKGQVLGRLAAQISTVLQGKDKPTYKPERDEGDMCVVINARDIVVTGSKMKSKLYRWHTGYVGHLKKRTLKEQMARDSTYVVRRAVVRMLPKNRLQDDRNRKLRIFPGSVHPFDDKPLENFVMPPRGGAQADKARRLARELERREKNKKLLAKRS